MQEWGADGTRIDRHYSRHRPLLERVIRDSKTMNMMSARQMVCEEVIKDPKAIWRLAKKKEPKRKKVIDANRKKEKKKTKR